MSPSQQSQIKRFCAPAIEAFKVYWPAILAIQLFALGLLFSYYWSASARDFFDQVAI